MFEVIKINFAKTENKTLKNIPKLITVIFVFNWISHELKLYDKGAQMMANIILPFDFN